MSENLNDTPAPAQPPQPELVRLVTAALEARNFKPKCSQCSTIGWATTYVHPVPVVTHSLTGDIIAAALLVCGKCGAQRQYNLNVLGIVVQPQERRVLTASEVAAQQQNRPQLIVP
jgi:hypothetical protein